MSHFVYALAIPALIGIQGKASFLLDNEVTTLGTGLLLARVYAVTDHKRLVLAVLSILGGLAFVPELVCTHVLHFYNWYIRTIVTGGSSFG